MPDTPIDQADNLTSIRLKVPTGTVPIPPEGRGQLHSPAEGELAIRLPDGSVVPVGGGGDFALAARNLLGPNGQILTDGTDPTVGIDITPIPPLPIRLSGPVQDQDGNPFGLQLSPPVVVETADLLALDTLSVEIVPALAGTIWPVAVFLEGEEGTTGYACDPGSNVNVGWGAVSGNEAGSGRSAIVIDAAVLDAPRRVYAPTPARQYAAGIEVNAALKLGVDTPLTGGDGSLTARVVYWVIPVAT